LFSQFIIKRQALEKTDIYLEIYGQLIKYEDRKKCDMALMFSWFLVADPALVKSDW